jgi:ABC-2 type transport system permease protein
MTAVTDDIGERAPAPGPSAAMPWTRTFAWSVRRELWENRAVYIGPMIAAGIILVGFVISLFTLPRRLQAAAALDPAARASRLEAPYDMAAMAVLAIAFLIGVFYCLNALHGERRDRSILFWKSLPVSDLTTVLSKAAIPLAVLPAVVFVVVVATQLVMMALHTLVILGSGHDPAVLWSQVNLFRTSLILFYGLITLALWHAPVYAWMLLVSGWARRMAFVWAVGPFLALFALERMIFGTTNLVRLVGQRIAGGFEAAFVVGPRARGVVPHSPQLDPLGFIATPGLWIGLLVAAALLAAAVWLRRRREPI